jgi:hypothetical protein
MQHMFVHSVIIKMQGPRQKVLHTPAGARLSCGSANLTLLLECCLHQTRLVTRNMSVTHVGTRPAHCFNQLAISFELFVVFGSLCSSWHPHSSEI